jgi:hypothetical protein
MNATSTQALVLLRVLFRHMGPSRLGWQRGGGVGLSPTPPRMPCSDVLLVSYRNRLWLTSRMSRMSRNASSETYRPRFMAIPPSASTPWLLSSGVLMEFLHDFGDESGRVSRGKRRSAKEVKQVVVLADRCWIFQP